MRICFGKLTIIGSDNSLLPGWHQAIIWTSAGILFIGPLGTNFSKISIGILTFSIKRMHLKMSSAKWRAISLWIPTIQEMPTTMDNYDNLSIIEERKFCSWLVSAKRLQLGSQCKQTMLYKSKYPDFLIPATSLYQSSNILDHTSATLGSVFIIITHTLNLSHLMMMSCNGNYFLITGPLWS